MKVTIDISDAQFMAVLAMYPATAEQTEEALDVIHKTPELDITEQCRREVELPLAIAAYAIAALLSQLQNNTQE